VKICYADLAMTKLREWERSSNDGVLWMIAGLAMTRLRRWRRPSNDGVPWDDRRPCNDETARVEETFQACKFRNDVVPRDCVLTQNQYGPRVAMTRSKGRYQKLANMEA